MTEDKIEFGLSMIRAFKNETPNPVARAVADLALEALLELRELKASPTRSTTFGKPLSRRQRQILDLLNDELTYDQAAKRLGVSVNTVRHHVRALYRKLGAKTHAQASMAVAGEIQVG